jgi:hypothetical protein
MIVKIVAIGQGADPTTAIYNTSVVKIYNTTSSQDHFYTFSADSLD